MHGNAPRVAISINGRRIDEATTESSTSRPGVKKAPRAYRQWRLAGGMTLTRGWNEIILELADPKVGPVTILEVQAGFYPRKVAEGSKLQP